MILYVCLLRYYFFIFTTFRVFNLLQQYVAKEGTYKIYVFFSAHMFKFSYIIIDVVTNSVTWNFKSNENIVKLEIWKNATNSVSNLKDFK